MNGKINLSFFLFFFFPFLLHAASEMELIKLIDQKKYAEVLRYFPENPVGSEPLLILKAHAQLGMAGYEPLELMQKVRAVQKSSNEVIADYLKNCPMVVLGKKLDGDVRCLVVRLFNQIPHHSNPMLVASRDTFRLILNKGAMGRQDRLLYAIVELSVVLSKFREVLFMYNKIDPNKVSYEEAKAIFLMIRSAGEDFESFVSQYKQKDLQVIFDHHLFGSKDNLLLKMSVEGKVEFLNESGLPMFFRVTDMDLETTTELAGRNIIIQIIDRADNFFRSNDSSNPLK